MNNCRIQKLAAALRNNVLTLLFAAAAFLSAPASAVSSFPDVAPTSWAASYVEAIYAAGITTGCGGGNFCPANPVTREQMAAFLIRAKAGEPPTEYCQGVAPFGDVGGGAWSCGYVKWLGEMAITTGCGAGNYCPLQNVTREQMAAFLVRAMEGEPAANYCASGSGFSDVTVANGFCKYIKRLAELGVTTGCGGGNYCPTQTVTRDQMAAFLARAFLGVGAASTWKKKPTLVEVSATDTQALTASWLPVDDGITPQSSITYQFHLSTQADFLPDATTLAASGAGILSAQVSGLTPGATYYARVRAIGPSAQQTTSDTTQITLPRVDAVVNPGISTRVLGAGEAAQSDPNTFLLAPGAAAPAIGSLLANSQGDGYLKKVVSVVDVGGQWQVTTVPAGLHEAYQQLELSGSVRIAPLPATGALLAETRSTTARVSQGPDGNVTMAWPQTGFTLSAPTSQAASIATSKPLSAELNGKLRATRTGEPLYSETTVRQTVSGAWVRVTGPQAVSIVPGNTAATKITLNVFHDDQTFFGYDPIPIAICKIDDVVVDAPSGKSADGLATVGTLTPTLQETDPLYGGGTYQATRIANLSVQLSPIAAQVADQAYMVRFTAYVDEAGNGCVDATRPLLLPWKEKIRFELPVYVVSEPNFPEAEEKTLSFDGGFKVVNDTRFTFTPELSTEVLIQGLSVKKASLIARANAQVDHELSITATGAASLDATKTLIEPRNFTKVFMAGSVPVVMTGNFSVDMHVEGAVTGAMKASQTANLKFDSLEYGFEYANGMWNAVQSVKPVYNMKLSGEADAEANLTITLLPKLKVTFYEALTGRLVVDPHLMAEAGLHGHVYADVVPQGVTLDADYWLTKGQLSGGLNAWIYARVEGCELSMCIWPDAANEDDYKTYRKLELIAETPILGIPALSAVKDVAAHHPTNSRAILFRGSYSEVANPFRATFGGPDAFIGFAQWTKPKVIALNDTGYQVLDTLNGAADEAWIAFDKPGTYTVRLGGYSSLGGWARQMAEVSVTIDDADNDGMLDWWEQYYNVTDPAADPDSDGTSNLAEFNAGTNPNVSDLEQFSLSVSYLGYSTYILGTQPPMVSATAPLACDGTGCSGPVLAGQSVTLHAWGGDSYAFVGWGGDCAGTVGDACELVMDAAKNVTASFQLVGHPLAVTYLGASGGGTVSGLPSWFVCDANGCTGTFAAGQTTGLKAEPNPGYVFAGWGGYCSFETSDTCTLGWLTAATTVTATFQSDGSTPTGKLNDTGIQFCGAALAGNSTCDGTQPAGQDAQYGRDAQATAGTLTKVGGGEAGFDFTALDASGNPTTPSSGANPHPCVRDNVTGLVWEVKTADGGLRDRGWTYTWYNFASPDGNPGTTSGGTCYQTGRCDTEKYVADINAAGLCGYSDWRMPTVKELEGIAHMGRTNPAVDPTYFPNTLSIGYWSGSPNALSSLRAWVVYFSSGTANGEYSPRANYYAVRLIRGGS